jgi:hypothetical protein
MRAESLVKEGKTKSSGFASSSRNDNDRATTPHDRGRATKRQQTVG